jgi:hypothetical protein
MNLRLIGKRFSGLIAVAVLLLGIATVSNAQRRNWDGYPNLGGSLDLRQTALNAGFNEGSKEGRNDNSRGRRSNYTDFSAYRNATKDYSSRLGERNLYMQYYRLAFESGYNTEIGVANNPRGNQNYPPINQNNPVPVWNDPNYRQNRPGRDWGRYGTYGGNANFRQTALNAGYNEGIKQGRKDRGRGWRDPNDFSAYRNANKDYSTRLGGDLQLYQRYYREGFQNGYADGLNGY